MPSKRKKTLTMSTTPSQSDSISQVLNTPELLELILLELATDLQQNSKPRKKLEPMHTFAKLSRVNKFFKANIAGSKKLQNILPHSGYRRKIALAPLGWLFEKELGIEFSPRSRHGSYWETSPFHAVLSSADWKQLAEFNEKKNLRDAKWRDILIAGLEDPEKLPKVIKIDIQFRKGLRWRVGQSRDCSEVDNHCMEIDPEDNLGSVFDRYQTLMHRAEEIYWQSWKVNDKKVTPIGYVNLSNPRMTDEIVRLS